jgi:hypothetical protein
MYREFKDICAYVEKHGTKQTPDDLYSISSQTFVLGDLIFKRLNDNGIRIKILWYKDIIIGYVRVEYSDIMERYDDQTIRSLYSSLICGI